jgi:hypothetical protein
MAASGAIGTMADGLMTMLTTIASMKVAPDADPELLANLESMIVTGIQTAEAGKLEGQMKAMAPGGGGPAAGANLMGMLGGGGGPPAPPAPMPMPGGGAGATNPMGRMAPPNPDELRRTLSLG